MLAQKDVGSVIRWRVYLRPYGKGDESKESERGDGESVRHQTADLLGVLTKGSSLHWEWQILRAVLGAGLLRLGPCSELQSG